MSSLIQIILFVVFTIIAILLGFLISYFVVIKKGKKQIKTQGSFNEEHARSMYVMYKHKAPTSKQVEAIVQAYKNNK
ncbi:MAG: hypothetical protein LBB95_01930 [Mycoplasmataceae bacterium]|jgi:uncharacterized protein YneF (UPF0154 family)|nr:hypothetical protein [Mycoplasmataceae bacterium]